MMQIAFPTPVLIFVKPYLLVVKCGLNPINHKNKSQNNGFHSKIDKFGIQSSPTGPSSPSAHKTLGHRGPFTSVPLVVFASLNCYNYLNLFTIC